MEEGVKNVATLNFSAFAQAIQSGTANMEPTNVVRLIFEAVTSCDNVMNPAKDAYYDSKECLAYFKAEANVSPKIAEATKVMVVCRHAEDYFSGIFLDSILPQRENNVVENLVNAINADETIPTATKDMFMSAVSEGEYSQLYYQVFLYSLGSPNNQNKKKKKVKTAEVWSSLTELDSVMKQLPHPVKLTPPEELAEAELTYSTQLLKAYTDDAGTEINSKNVAGSIYNTHFKRQRQNFYCAESVNRAVVEAFTPDEDVFGDFKDEVYASIIDEYEDQQGSRPYDRVKAVVKAAGNAPLSKSVLVHLPKWVGPEEKKGTCHMLVNDERISWVDEGDKTV